MIERKEYAKVKILQRKITMLTALADI